MIQTNGRPAAAFALMAGLLSMGPAWAARLVASHDGASAWLLNAQGAISRVDLRDGRATPWSDGNGGSAQGQPPLPAADIALSGDGATLFALVPASDGRTTRLHALDTSSGQERAHWEVRGRGRFLAVTTDGAHACIVGLKAGGQGRRANKAEVQDDDWTLIVVDLATGKQSPPVSPGLTPVAVALMELPGSGAKILLAARDRLATYSLEPLRVSWFYKSPGENNDIAVPPGSPVVCVLRGSSLAVIDPGRRPTQGGRVQLGEDDATAVIALPARGRALAVAGDGRTAAVLHDDATAITLVDLAAGQTLSTERLGGPHDLLAGRMMAEGGDKLALALASSTHPDGAAETLRVDAPAAPAPPPTPIPPQPARAAPEEKFELKVIVPEPPRTAPVSVPPEQLAAPPGDPTPPAAKPEPAATPPPTPPPAPVLPPRPVSGAALQGRLTGDFTQAREVLFYGPGNIIKLHARAKVEADGTFSLPLPPAGSYRVVVSAGAGTHIFTRPEFRTLTVAEGAGGLEGIDFEVRGAIK